MHSSIILTMALNLKNEVDCLFVCLFSVESDRKLGELLAQKFDSQFSAGCRSLNPEVREEFRKLFDLRTGRVRRGQYYVLLACLVLDHV